MTNERRELVKALAAASYDRKNGIFGWIDAAKLAADALLAELDKESPPTHAAADPMYAAPSQEGAGSATAAPGGEPKERTCVWTRIGVSLCETQCGAIWGGYPESNNGKCPYCGGKIITEAT